MKKDWYIMFQPQLWLSDPCVRRCSLAAKGLWIDLLTLMFSNGNTGEIGGTFEELNRMVGGSSVQEIIDLIGELENKKVANVMICNATSERFFDTPVMVVNRRMKRESDKRKMNKLRVVKFREKKRNAESNAGCNGAVTQHINNNNNSNSNKKKNKQKKKAVPKIQYAEKVFLKESEYLALKTQYPDQYQAIIDKLNNTKMSSGKTYQSDYHAILNWVIDAVMEKQNKSTGKGSSNQEYGDRALKAWADVLKCIKDNKSVSDLCSEKALRNIGGIRTVRMADANQLIRYQREFERYYQLYLKEGMAI